MASFPRVNGVHNLHIWEISSSQHASGTRVSTVSDSVVDYQMTLKEMKDMLRERYNKAHTTLEVEGESCNADSCHLD